MSTSTSTSAHDSRSGTLTARGLRPLSQLAASRSHGDRLRYLGGCRCTECRRANTQYELARAAARRNGDWNGIVPAARARQHVESLAAQGVGYRQLADAACVAVSIVRDIKAGKRVNLRARSERAILAVTLQAAADHAMVDAGPTWKLLDELIASGYTKAELARQLGYVAPALQIKRTQCHVRSAYDVQRLYQRLRRVPQAPTARLIAQLRQEGYRQARIEQMLADLAVREGLPPPDLTVYGRGYISAAAADLVRRLHEQVMEPEVA